MSDGRMKPSGLPQNEYDEFVRAARSIGLSESAFELEWLPYDEDGNLFSKVYRVRVRAGRSGRQRVYIGGGRIGWVYLACQDLKNRVFS